MADTNELTHGERIGAFRNEWRGRQVSIFAHPTDPTRVITCGVPLYGVIGVGGWNTKIWTDEPRDEFARYIGTYNKVYR